MFARTGSIGVGHNDSDVIISTFVDPLDFLRHRMISKDMISGLHPPPRGDDDQGIKFVF